MSTTKKLIINDPIYGTITIYDGLIQQLISSAFFQRLRRIQQMSAAHLTFPGATHTRFNHSLGAYHLMTLALQQLEDKGTEVSADEKQAAQIAILLHDIGHGPFSHTLEGTILENVNHEDVSLAIMNALNEHHKFNLNLAIQIFRGTYNRKFFHQLVSSQLDVDRLDYLTRDSFYSGVAEGVIGFDRIINMMTVHNNELVIQEKGVYSIEQFLISRRIMYWQVYYHKTVWATEQLVKNILLRAKALYLKGFFSPYEFQNLFFFIYNKFEPGNTKHLARFNLLDDSEIIHLVKFGQQSDDKLFAILCNAYLNRTLYKVVISNNSVDKINLNVIAESIKTTLKIDKDDLPYFLFEKIIRNDIYDKKEENKILILNKNGETTDLATIDSVLIKTAIHSSQSKYYKGYWRT